MRREHHQIGGVSFFVHHPIVVTFRRGRGGSEIVHTNGGDGDAADSTDIDIKMYNVP